jgi:hypothetical protein
LQMLDGHNSTFSKDPQPFSAWLLIASFYCSTLFMQCFCSTQCFVWLFSVKLFSVFSVLTGSQQTSYSRQCHLCLSIGSERPITIIDIEGYTEQISLYWLSRWRDRQSWIFLTLFDYYHNPSPTWTLLDLLNEFTIEDSRLLGICITTVDQNWFTERLTGAKCTGE